MKLLGFDIGGTKCAVILGAAADGNLTIEERVAFPTPAGPSAATEEMFSRAEALLSKHSLAAGDVAGIGISCGGPLDSRRGVVLSPPNLPGWDEVPIVAMTEKRFGRPAAVQNDANACALAEWKFGAGRGSSNMVFFTFGTGMGAGLILDGRLYSGTCDLAGEVGHMRLSDFGPAGFGKAGSFEGWCSGGGIAQVGRTMARQRIQTGEKTGYCSSLDELPAVTAKSIADAAHAGDATAAEVYRLCSEYLGRGLSVIIDVINPEVIVLGSIYGRSRDLIEPYMMETIARESIGFSAAACRIVPAGLGERIGDMAALVLAEAASEKNFNL